LLVQDGSAAPIAGARVHFAIDSGGGALADTVLPTDASGHVVLSGWRLGNFGVNTVIAVAGNSAVTIHATADPPYAATAFSASLTGHGMVPPVITFDTAHAELTAGVAIVNFTVSASNATATQVRVHVATAGVNGPARMDVCGIGVSPACAAGPVTITGSGTAITITTDSLISAMRRFGAYFVLSTAAHPAGHIRGQIIPSFP
jgi:hypothetical protein